MERNGPLPASGGEGLLRSCSASFSLWQSGRDLTLVALCSETVLNFGLFTPEDEDTVMRATEAINGICFVNLAHLL